MNSSDITRFRSTFLPLLKGLDLDKVILFGSMADGTCKADSDIDLYVVTRDEFVPASWSEQNRLYLSVSRRLRELRKHYPIDLIVHTRAMHRKFVTMQSSFAREVMTKGVALYGNPKWSHG